MDGRGHPRDVGAAVAASAAIPLAQCDDDGTVTWLNDLARNVLHVDVGDDLTTIAVGHARTQLRAFLDGFDRSDRRARIEIVTVTGTPLEIIASNDTTGAVTIVAYDLSAFRTELEQVRRSAHTDHLTGLANRLALFEHAHQVRMHAAVHATTPAVAVVDLDQFKVINDTYGHAHGDEALCHAATVLAEQLVPGNHRLDPSQPRTGRPDVPDDGPGELVARFGGDEFTVCFPDGGTDRAYAYATAVTDALTSGFKLTSGDHITISASFGIAAVDVHSDVGHALQEADVALYRAKSLQRSNIEVYTPSDDTAEMRHLNRTVEELRRRADIDTRTGLARDHLFDIDLPHLTERSHRAGRPVSVIIVDLDSFHAYNERYLYEAGHRALRSVAATISGAVRAADRCYRYGGEEFAVILADTGADEATATAHRIREAVEALAIPHESTERGVLTVSAGVATARPGHRTEPQWIINGASVAVLAAKEAGRNRVRAADPVQVAPPIPSRR